MPSTKAWKGFPPLPRQSLLDLMLILDQPLIEYETFRVPLCMPPQALEETKIKINTLCVLFQKNHAYKGFMRFQLKRQKVN